MKQERTSYAFLMEMIWVCAFFLICATIFVMAFAKAEDLSRRADVLNQAVQAMSNTLEISFSEVSSGQFEHPEELVPVFDSIAGQYSSSDFVLTADPLIENGLLTLTITAADPEDGSVIDALTGAIALPEGGIS